VPSFDYSDIASELVGQQAATAAPAPAPQSAEFDYSAIARDVVKTEPQVQAPAERLADEDRKAQMLRWRVLNETRAPEEQAEILKMSSALGWSPETIAADMPKARNAVEASKLDTEAVLHAHPALAEFLGDPRTSALARSDTERLTGLAYLVGEGQTPGAVELWLKQRSLSRENHDLQTQLLLGTTPDENAQAPEVDPTGVGVPAQPMRPLAQDEKARLRAQVQKNEQELHRLRSFGDGVEELGFGAKQLARTARLLIDMGPEMAKGAAAALVGSVGPLGPVSGAAAGTAFWAYETGPGVYWQLSELKGQDGKPLLSEEEAKNYALGASVPLGALMSVGLEGAGLSFTKWASSKPIMEKALSVLAKDSVEKVLARKGMAAALGRAALNYGTHSVQGGLVMASQSALTQATLEIAAGQHGVDAPGTITDAFADGFSTGIRDFAIIAAWGPARRMLAEHGQIRASQESAQVLRDIAENTRESKLAQRDPERFGKLSTNSAPTRRSTSRARRSTSSPRRRRSPRANWRPASSATRARPTTLASRPAPSRFRWASGPRRSSLPATTRSSERTRARASTN
jgi:hypothetical protein